MSPYVNGLIDLPWWGYVLVALVLTHITIASVTIFLHRAQAHRALDLHPIASHFFRFWLWLTTGIVTREWASIHRKHHARCETPEDPHSPQVLGIRKVLLEGAEVVSGGGQEPGNPGALRARHPGRLAGAKSLHPPFQPRHRPHAGHRPAPVRPLGVTLWAVQMLWIPVTAAGIINGVGHYWGYRNFTCEDASTNILPWGILIGGEELHNNHHAYGSSAKLSNRWYEFDIGWLYIRTLEILGLASVKKVAPKVRWGEIKHFCDTDLLHAIITHRYDVLTRYRRAMKQACAQELDKLRGNLSDVAKVRRWLNLDQDALKPAEKAELLSLLAQSDRLKTLYQMRQDLAALWVRSTASSEQLVRQLQDWCQKAEASGIEALSRFSRRLRCYA
jgi:stearoyl-CoA desaturase (delta-9 desaturase)